MSKTFFFFFHTRIKLIVVDKFLSISALVSYLPAYSAFFFFADVYDIFHHVKLNNSNNKIKYARRFL